MLACAVCQSSTTLCIAPPSAEPPPTMPWMPCLAMNSSARIEPPWIGCQHSTGRLKGRGTEGELFEGVAAIRHVGRQRVVLALMREALVVEGIEDDIDLLLKERPIGLRVAQWGAERFSLARVVAATDAKDDAAAGENVNGGEVLRQPQRVPHRSDIEAATNLDVFRSVREVQCHKDGVGNAFSAFGLEVVLGHPETIVAKPIHERGHGLGLAQRSCEV